MYFIVSVIPSDFVFAVKCRRCCRFAVTQGKLVEDFASLLKSLWSQEYLCIFPSKFKRVLIKYKPQFAGNEQQDSQVGFPINAAFFVCETPILKMREPLTCVKSSGYVFVVVVLEK